MRRTPEPGIFRRHNRLALLGAAVLVAFGWRAISSGGELLRSGPITLLSSAAYGYATIAAIMIARGLGATRRERVIWLLAASNIPVPLLKWSSMPHVLATASVASGIAQLVASGLLASEAITGWRAAGGGSEAP